MSKLRVAVLGCGYWGPNLIRNFASCPLTEVVAACDTSPWRLEAVRRSHGQLARVESLDRLLDMELDAVAIATPVSTHFALAQRCLEAGLHVLIEKPFTATVAEAEQLIALARRQARVLMVDHTYLFGNPVRKIKQIIDSGELGELYYVDSIRINLGLFQHDVNVIWDLAPHDISIIEYVLGRRPRSISSWGCAHAHPAIEDVAYVNIDYADRLQANLHVNWLSPVKVRQMIFAGSEKSLIFNELNTAEPIKIYDRGISFDADAEDRHKRLVSYRTGDIWSPHIEPGEALQAVVAHFAECIRDGQTPLSDGGLGLRVVQLLEAATRSIRAQGGRIVLPMGNEHHAGSDVQTNGSGQLPPRGAGRGAGQRRHAARVRQSVRLPDRG